MKTTTHFLTGKEIKVNTNLEHWLLYFILYPVCNNISLNTKLNLLRHRLGYYPEDANGNCWWCGKDHRVTPLSEYRYKTPEQKVKELYD